MSARTSVVVDAPPVTATEVAVLGLLTDGERSGYDLLRAAERSVGFFWTPAKTQLYAVLRKLVENGFATSRHVKQSDRPDKTLYRITYAGLDRLRAGLEQVRSSVNRNPLELRIFYGAHRSREAVIADLERVRDHARELLAELEEIEQTFDRDQDLFKYLSLLRGKETATADIRWAEHALDLLNG